MKLINNDCIAAMKEMPDNSVDSIVTDPPYELGFMGKSWDSTGIAFNVEVWQEALRVLKPGGHLIAFSGSRTYHRMAVAIEDAGFQIRDQIMWIYGSGFPKSHNVANAIDKSKGAGNRGHAISSGSQIHPTTGLKRPNGELLSKYESRTKESEGWAGWGTALKPAHEPMVLARKPLVGTVAANVLEWGVGGLNIDGSRVAGVLDGDPNCFAKTDGGWAVAELHDAPVVRSEGRWPANVIHDGSEEVVELFPDTKSQSGKKQPNNTNNEVYSGTWNAQPDKIGGFDDSGSAARFFYCAKTSKRDRNEGLDGFEAKQTLGGGGLTEAGGAYGSIKAQAKNHHPTVKPTDLMRYLCKLVTPPGGTVLDPFMGSGSTGKGALLEGFDFIGIEQSAEYIEIAKARIEFAKNESANE